MFILWMLITPSFKKSLIVEQFQGYYLNNSYFVKCRKEPLLICFTSKSQNCCQWNTVNRCSDRFNKILFCTAKSKSKYCIGNIQRTISLWLWNIKMAIKKIQIKLLKIATKNNLISLLLKTGRDWLVTVSFTLTVYFTWV